MTDKEIYQQIEEYSEEANALYERIHEQVETSIVRHAQAKKKRKKLFAGILSVAVVLVVTLSIVLPITIPSRDDKFWFCDTDEFFRERLDCNLKEYSEINNLSLLYLDRYQYAEGLFTARYYEKGKESDTVYLYESFEDRKSGYFIQVIAMECDSAVDKFDWRYDEYLNATINGVQIDYVLSIICSSARFEYQGYKYYLVIDNKVTSDFLLATIESMFHN